MNASSESGLWATWIVVIKSLRGGANRGERGVDVVLVEEILRQRDRAFGRYGGDQPRIERAGARLVLFQPGDARGEDQPQQMRRALSKDGVGLRVCQPYVAAHLTQTTEVVALVEVERIQHLVGGTRHREEGAHGVLPAGLVLRHDAVVETLGALFRSQLADVRRTRHRTRRSRGSVAG